MMNELEIVVLGNLPQLKRTSIFNLINRVDLEALFYMQSENIKIQCLYLQITRESEKECWDSVIRVIGEIFQMPESQDRICDP